MKPEAYLSQKIKDINLTLIRLENEKQEYASQANWAIVQAIKATIAIERVRLRTYQEILEADE